MQALGCSFRGGFRRNHLRERSSGVTEGWGLVTEEARRPGPARGLGGMSRPLLSNPPGVLLSEPPSKNQSGTLQKNQLPTSYPLGGVGHSGHLAKMVKNQRFWPNIQKKIQRLRHRVAIFSHFWSTPPPRVWSQKTNKPPPLGDEVGYTLSNGMVMRQSAHGLLPG